MVISERLKRLREAQNLSQGDIQARTGLFRCYLSRLENGRTVPSIETLEKLARALDVPLHQLFTDDEAPVKKLRVPKQQPDSIWGLDRKTANNAGWSSVPPPKSASTAISSRCLVLRDVHEAEVSISWTR
jgi:transcriptional regulator with XRE-family HTH domain